jgi:glyoxylase-like metal-dependent hydrolase (beta-lactamase superfamily II)
MSEVPVHAVQVPTPFFEGTSNAYLLVGDPLTLIDTGMAGERNLYLLDLGLRDRGFRIDQIERIVLTHKHADHMGLARAIHDRSGAQVWVHEQDLDEVVHYDERSKDFRAAVVDRLLEWGAPQEYFATATANFRGRDALAASAPAGSFRDGDQLPMSDAPLEILHTPGHTLGSVCIRWGRFLFSGDHVLPSTTPNVGIGELGRRGMLQIYLDSLQAITQVQTDRLLVFPGHGAAFHGLADRAQAIIQHHYERLDRVAALLDRQRPTQVFEVASRLFGNLEGFHAALGAAEAFVHLEHLENAGRIRRNPSGFLPI